MSTNHDKPALIVVEVALCRRLLKGAEQLAYLLATDNLLEAARAISAADESGLGRDRDWIRRALKDLGHAERAS